MPLLMTLPFVLIGGAIVGVCGSSLYAYLFGGSRLDPSQWPRADATVIGHRVIRVWPRGQPIRQQKVEAAVRVRLNLPGAAETEVRPAALRALSVPWPLGWTYEQFAAEYRNLALSQAQDLLPAGSVVSVHYDADLLARRGRANATASDNRANRRQSILFLSGGCCFGWIFLAPGLLMLWAIFFAPRA